MTERITNPMEFSDCHRNVTVVMENRFTVPNGSERGEEPLKLFGKWSHVKVALIDSNRQSLSYRIYPREMGLIRRKTDAVAVRKICRDDRSRSTAEIRSPGYDGSERLPLTAPQRAVR